MIPIENKLISLLNFAGDTHASFDHTIKEIMACNSLLDLVGSARSNYVLADRLRSGIRKQALSHGILWHTITSIMLSLKLMQWALFADVIACLSSAYASIDADSQATPEDPAFVASHTSHRHHSKRPQASRSSMDKKASSIINELAPSVVSRDIGGSAGPRA